MFARLDWSLLAFVPAVLLTIILHEIAHGVVAKWLGDPTAKRMGRLTLNPIPHIDPVGLLMMVFVGFGWAKPVPVDMRYFKKPKRDMALVALAGPVMNFLIAFVALFLLHFIVGVFPEALNWQMSTDFFGEGITSIPVLYFFFYMLALVSIGLGLFNLVPLPPLDGSKILGACFPERIYFTILRYERYGMFLFLGIMLLGNFVPEFNPFGWLGSLRGSIFNWMYELTRKPFTLLGVGGLV